MAMRKSGSGRPRNPVHQLFVYDEASGYSHCHVNDCKEKLKGNHGGNLERHINRAHPEERQRLIAEKEALKSSIGECKKKKKYIHLTADEIRDSGIGKLLDPILDALPQAENFAISAENVRALVANGAGEMRQSIKEEARVISPVSERLESEDYDDLESTAHTDEINAESLFILTDPLRQTQWAKEEGTNIGNSQLPNNQPSSKKVQNESAVSQHVNKTSTGPDEEVKDTFVTFGNYVAQELRTIVDDRYSVQVAKRKINEILFEATTGAYRR